MVMAKFVPRMTGCGSLARHRSVQQRRHRQRKEASQKFTFSRFKSDGMQFKIFAEFGIFLEIKRMMTLSFDIFESLII